jgi:hypothetical protein
VELKRLIAGRREPEIIAHLQTLVPEFKPASFQSQSLEPVFDQRPNGLLSVS